MPHLLSLLLGGAVLLTLAEGAVLAAEPAAVAAAVTDLPACLRLAQEHPDAGFKAAMVWEDRGGKDTARLCQAMALYHQGQFAGAGRRLDALVPVLAPQDRARTARLQAQAGWAWLQAGEAEGALAKAEADYTAALMVLRDDPELYIDRAFARTALGNNAGAVDDLTVVLLGAPTRTDALLYRAESYRKLGNVAAATLDVGKVLTQDGHNVEALLLRGNIRAGSGDMRGAEADWTKVEALAPDGQQGIEAADNIRRLHLGTPLEATNTKSP